MKLAITKLRLDGGTQPRAELDEATAARYADELRAGAKFPPVVVFHDGSDHWLADGFHRVAALKLLGIKAVDADVRQGDKRAAVLFSVGANHDHGLPRTNADKRRAVLTLLQDEEWSGWSDRAIAKVARVSHVYVAQLRAERGNVSTSRRGLDGKTYSAEPRLDLEARQILSHHDVMDERAEVRALIELPPEQQREIAKVIAESPTPLTVTKAIKRARRAGRIPNDAYYTPDPLALAIARDLFRKGIQPKRILEPSSGGGAFLRACRIVFPDAELFAVDIDPKARAVAEEVGARFQEANFLTCDWAGKRFDLVLGNPEYLHAQEHVERARQLLRRDGAVNFLLRINFLGADERKELNAGPGREVCPVIPRPSFTENGKTDASEYGSFQWRPGRTMPSYLGDPILWDPNAATTEAAA